MASTIQVRVDDKLKNDAEKLFKELGTDVTTAVRIFLTQAVACEGFPFEIKKNTASTKETFRSVTEEEAARILYNALSGVGAAHSPKIGIARGILESPEDLDKYNEEIIDLFGGVK